MRGLKKVTGAILVGRRLFPAMMPIRLKDNNPCHGRIEGIYVWKALRHRNKVGFGPCRDGGSGAAVGSGGGCLDLRMRGGFIKNDDFCTQEKARYIKAVCQFYDDF